MALEWFWDKSKGSALKVGRGGITAILTVELWSLEIFGAYGLSTGRCRKVGGNVGVW